MTKQATVDKKQISIYKVTNLKNGKCYIGQTGSTVANRFSQHWYDATVCKKHNPFHKALRKYGKDCFLHELVLICDDSMANFYENELINIFSSFASKNTGYNVANPLDHFRSISTTQKGEMHSMAKLTLNNVLEIKSNTGMSHFDCASKFNVSYATIKNIRLGRAWAESGFTLPIGSYKKDLKSGEKHHACVISDDVRNKIKDDTTTNSVDLAKKYNIDKSLITSIRGAQPQIKRKRTIDDKIAQYVLDNPDIANSELSKITSISAATISRIKTGKQFGHLVSNAKSLQWSIFFDRQKKAVGC